MERNKGLSERETTSRSDLANVRDIPRREKVVSSPRAKQRFAKVQRSADGAQQNLAPATN
jgi:hypothetical protein